jgi:hypothetical protein
MRLIYSQNATMDIASMETLNVKDPDIEKKCQERILQMQITKKQLGATKISAEMVQVLINYYFI